MALSILSRNNGCALSIVSAGYGLVGLDSPLKPYSATFSPGPDSVASHGVDPVRAGQEWWQALAEIPALADSGPRSLGGLATAQPDALFLVALSAPYVRALRDDLVSAAAKLRGAGRLVLVSAGTHEFGGLDGLVPVSVALQHGLGGARLSLNIRVARFLLGESATHRWAMDEMVRVLGGLIENPQGGPRRPRDRMTDAEVIAFIKHVRRDEPDVPKSRLLRRLRHEGKACEQGRFGELFMRTVSK